MAMIGTGTRRAIVAAAAAIAIGVGVVAFGPFGSSSGGLSGETAVADGPVLDLDWEMLVPEAARTAALESAGVVLHEELADDTSPYQQMTDVSQVRADLNGKRVRIPGYMTPLSFDEAEVSEFLLVPYIGACVHVPPPPANQIVMVNVDGTVPVLEMWEPFLAVGTLYTQAASTELAEVAYTLALDHLEIYEEPEIDVYDDLGVGDSGGVDPSLPEMSTQMGTELGRVFDEAFGAPGDGLAAGAATPAAAPEPATVPAAVPAASPEATPTE